MSYAIWKFKLLTRDRQHVLMPAGAEILSAHAQFEDVVIWARVNVDEPVVVKREIQVLATGEETDWPHLRFIGTVLLEGGNLVLHVFERLGKQPV